MQFYSLFLSVFVFGSCQSNEPLDPAFQKEVIGRTLAESNIDYSFYDDLINDQKEFISGLTGHSQINEGVTISSRWFESEKVEVRKLLASSFRQINLTPIQHDYEVNMPDKNKELNPFIGANIYAVIPATTPTNKYIIIGAHFDTVEGTPGASDNASGCALVYGVGKALLELEERNMNVVLIYFDQEEQGPAGAFAFVQFIKNEKWDIHAVHTIDQIGWDQDGDRNIEIEVPTASLKKSYRKHARNFGVKAIRTNETSSDKKAFKEAGFPALGVTEEYRNGDTSPHRHYGTDTYETVNFDYLAYSTLLVFKVIEDAVSTIH